jgi:Ca-activated chloride channel family protein
MEPGGSTPGESGIKLAYDVAKKHFIEKGNNRIILATDGDFNVGVQTEQELDELISRHRESGIYLTCLGVGMGNYKDSKIQTLARKGNGNFAYIDNSQEADKIIMKEFTQTLYTIDDAHMHVTFDPSLVKQYRLIGLIIGRSSWIQLLKWKEAKLVQANPLQLLLKLSQILQVVQMYIRIILRK